MLYGKVQEESHVPKLKRELEKAQIEWSTLVKAHSLGRRYKKGEEVGGQSG